MEKDEFKWLDAIPNLSDERLILYIKGLMRRLQDEEKTETRTSLGQRLGALQVEAEQRNLVF